MGVSYSVYCKKCGYKKTLKSGVGFLYVKTYLETIDKGRQGKLGKDIKQFILDNPAGVIDPELRIAQCEKCGEYASVKALTMYVPDTNKPRYDKDVVFPSEFEEYYKVYKEFHHKCKKCHGTMKLLPKKGNNNLKCPNCKDELLETVDAERWD